MKFRMLLGRTGMGKRFIVKPDALFHIARFHNSREAAEKIEVFHENLNEPEEPFIETEPNII